MKDSEMYEMNEHHIDKMRSIGNMKIRAWAVNVVLMLIVWIFTMMPWYINMVAHFMHASPDEAYILMIDLMALWSILNVTFFLAPALGAWWEMAMCRKKSGK